MTMNPSYKAIKIIKQSNISNHELAIFLNNISKEALVDYLIYSRLPINPNKLLKNKIIKLIINDRVFNVNNDIDMLSIDVNKLKILILTEHFALCSLMIYFTLSFLFFNIFSALLVDISSRGSFFNLPLIYP